MNGLFDSEWPRLAWFGLEAYAGGLVRLVAWQEGYLLLPFLLPAVVKAGPDCSSVCSLVTA